MQADYLNNSLQCTVQALKLNCTLQKLLCFKQVLICNAAKESVVLVANFENHIGPHVTFR